VSMNSFFERMVEPFFNIWLSPCDVSALLGLFHKQNMVLSGEEVREG